MIENYFNSSIIYISLMIILIILSLTALENIGVIPE